MSGHNPDSIRIPRPFFRMIPQTPMIREGLNLGRDIFRFENLDRAATSAWTTQGNFPTDQPFRRIMLDISYEASIGRLLDRPGPGLQEILINFGRLPYEIRHLEVLDSNRTFVEHSHDTGAEQDTNARAPGDWPCCGRGKQDRVGQEGRPLSKPRPHGCFCAGLDILGSTGTTLCRST